MPKRGQLFLWSGTNVIARGIQLFTSPPWSHTGFFLDSDTIIDSDWDWDPNNLGVQVRDAKVYLDNPGRLELIDLPFSEKEIELILKKAESYVGSLYDIPLIFSWVYKIWKGSQSFNSMFHLPKAMTCSEFVAQCIYDATGHEVIKNTPPHGIQPGDLLELENVKRSSN